MLYFDYTSTGLYPSLVVLVRKLKRTSIATSVRERRDKWLATLLRKARDNVRVGMLNICVPNGLQLMARND